MIKVDNVTKMFGDFKALQGLSLNVKKASIYALIGPNGAGKTTIMKHIAGIYRQDSGFITVEGQNVYENTRVKRRMVFIPDELFFFSTYSIKNMADFYSGIYPSWNKKRYEKLKEVFPIDEKRRITRLSKGMQKQVAFWLALCVMPDVILLDEPIDGLDPVMRRKVWNLILQDVAERETTVLISSHNLRELDDICDHVGIIHKGKMILEKELDAAKSEIHKLQIAFKEELIPAELREKLNILQESQVGGLISLIVKGDKEKIISDIKFVNPLIMNILPLTLEEIFIIELGGLGYEIKNIII